MRISSEKQQNVQVIKLQGRVDAATIPPLRDLIDSLAEQSIQDYVVDLGRVEFLDSAGMAVLVKLLKQARESQGDVVLLWSKQADANRILTLTRFDKVFHMEHNLQPALLYLRGA